MQLHILTTGTQELTQASEIAAAVHPFADFLHIREKHRSAKELLSWVERFAAAGVPLGKIIINDRLDVALAAGAGGVQLTEASLPLQRAKEIAGSMKLGRSVHQTKDALEIKKKEAEWLIFGHVFPTASKPDRKPAGLRKLKEVSAAASVPVIAIGGIQARHIQDIAQAGAEGIAVMSGIFTSGDPIAAAAYYRQEIQRVEEEHNENYSEWQTGRH